MSKDLIIQNMAVANDDYNQLIDNISSLWVTAKEKAINAVNTELLEANWQTGKYIVEFEQGGKVRAEYGKQLLVNLAKDLTLKNGRGFSRSNLLYMRKFYLSFPKSETVSHILTWSHYFEILKCDDPLEMQFHMNSSPIKLGQNRPKQTFLHSEVGHGSPTSSLKPLVIM